MHSIHRHIRSPVRRCSNNYVIFIILAIGFSTVKIVRLCRDWEFLHWIKSWANEGFLACFCSSSISFNLISRTNSRTPASSFRNNWCGSLRTRRWTLSFIVGKSGFSLERLGSFQALQRTRWYTRQTSSRTSIQHFRSRSSSSSSLASKSRRCRHETQSHVDDDSDEFDPGWVAAKQEQPLA